MKDQNSLEGPKSLILGPKTKDLTSRVRGDAISQFTSFYGITMPNFSNVSINSPTFQTLIAPLEECISQNTKARECQTINDAEWLMTGILRVLSESKSGRDFLQKLFHQGKTVGVSQFFAKLRSSRRLDHIQETLNSLLELMKVQRRDMDQLAKFDELKSFQVFAGDGHHHEHACHDIKVDGTHWSTQHFYCLNYRTLGMSHFAMAQIGGDNKKEHDLKACKKKNLEEMRQGAGKGVKTLYVWDKAIIDYLFWAEMKRGGVYFLTLVKSNLRFDHEKDLEFDKEDPINQGVLCDQMVKSRTDKCLVRKISYHCPVTDKVFNFLTNLHHSIRPGLIALLYKMRWEIEKIFDDVKNRLDETKSWSTHPNGKTAQACFICLTLNLLRLFEDKLETEGAQNLQDPERREKRLKEALDKKKMTLEDVPNLAGLIKRVVQRSTILIRWLRAHLFSPTPWSESVWLLRASYGEFGR